MIVFHAIAADEVAVTVVGELTNEWSRLGQAVCAAQLVRDR